VCESRLLPVQILQGFQTAPSDGKAAISKADIMRIIEYRSNDFYKQFAVDLFAFGYFMGGINFVDIAYLKTDNIVDGRLIYTRRKTHKLIRLPLQPKAQEIIERYRQDGALFLFPILSAFIKPSNNNAIEFTKSFPK
jgi:integrase